MSHGHPSPDYERLLELLAEQATLGLAPEERADMERLLVQFPDVDRDEFERLAAAIDLSLQPADREPLPAHLRGKIAASANIAIAAAPSAARENTPRVQLAPPPSAPLAPWLGWLVAAACLVVAAFFWWTTRPVSESPQVALEQLLAAPGTVTTPLAALDPEGKADGDVVWNEREQRGYMRLRGLAVNDPKIRQYQLWIFDKNQDERYPIDGGVFDVGREGEVIVPIHAAIRVAEPLMYAITVEKPGGVVVSNREEIVLLGKVSG